MQGKMSTTNMNLKDIVKVMSKNKRYTDVSVPYQAVTDKIYPLKQQQVTVLTACNLLKVS